MLRTERRHRVREVAETNSIRDAMQKPYCTPEEALELRAELERWARRHEELRDKTEQVVQSSRKLIEESRQLLISLSIDAD